MKPGPLLSRVPLFATLSPDELGRLSSALEMRSEPAGSLIMQEGLPGDEVIFLLEGQAEVIKAYGGEGERRLGIHGPGTVFGEMSLFSSEGLHTATVKAITPLLLCSLSQAGFEELLLQHPAVSLEMLRIMSRRLQTSDNEIVIDLTEKNRQLAQALGDLQAAQVQLVEKEKLEHELDLACQIQQSFLPRELPSLEGTELGAIMEPARAVGGDFYGLWRLADDRLALVVGDVSDKGMPAALGMALSYSLIRSEGTRPDCARPDGGPEPAEVFEIVNRQLFDMGVMEFFVTALFGVYEPSTGRFSYARAGHPAPVLLDRDGRSIPVPRQPGQPLGLFDTMLLDVQVLTLPVGGVMLVYSDGVTEAANPQGEEYGLASLEAALQRNRDASPPDICRRIRQSVVEYSSSSPNQDDVTLVCVKRTV